MPYKSIVVGTDGSKTAAVAVSHATDLAVMAGATLHIVSAGSRYITHAVDAVAMPVTVEIDEQVVEGELAEVIDEAEATAKARGAAVQTHAIVGDPVEALCELAEKLEADLLVVGNRGMKGITRFFTGSIPNTVSHNAPCSVLIVDTSAAA